MRHKNDAIKKAKELVNEHIKYGLDVKPAFFAAFVTVNHMTPAPAEMSLVKRTRNYLMCQIFGEFPALEILLIEDMINSLQKSAFNDEAKEIQSITKEIEELVNKKNAIIRDTLASLDNY